MSSAFDDVLLLLLIFVFLANSKRDIEEELSTAGQSKADMTSVVVEPDPDESRTEVIIVPKFLKGSKSIGQTHPPS
jgi:hypothetical protein